MPHNNKEHSNFIISGITFEPENRILKQGNAVFQLRKTQSDALNMLCKNYPQTVSYDELFNCIWAGRCVTRQSIAQAVRGLRVYLKDVDKEIIITVPKLGYRLGVSPEKNNFSEELQSEDEREKKTRKSVHGIVSFLFNSVFLRSKIDYIKKGSGLGIFFLTVSLITLAFISPGLI